MQVPLEISFHQVEPSEHIDEYVRKRANKLERYHPRIIRCRVAIEEPHRRHKHGNRFDVHLEVSVPGKTLAVDREPGDMDDHVDIYSTLRDAFEAMERQLESEVRARRGEVKTHEEPHPRGRVARLFPNDDFGFIETDDGREIYFHRNAVANDGFDHLRPGTNVKFVESSGDRGPQASAVFPNLK